MKTGFFTLLIVGLIATATSCNKCGYCKDSSGQSTGSAVCQTSNPIEALDAESYKQAKANCTAQGGTWIITK